ncbi:hypothetical protein HMPREF1544_10970 [Mucor circinelloides 1006PhL]|uniref:Uncharacterized protein n=1 Tax=Mucor circinelloides f. circinelloides (strain 1006PhL) TaxID=1220926 RepID=S2JR75_MUCC1|nr:hypothetical protein HMPREF1544_10970 [Mucor circinelloides 1006PhL]
MGVKILFLYLLRLLILLTSLGTLGCHVAQLILLNQVSGTGEWWPDFVPYILYYVGPIVSILSATVLLIVGCVFSKSLWSDRITSCINLLLFIAIIVYNSLTSGTVPWMGSVSNSNTSTMKGYVTYCSNYSDSLMSNRCWLTNGTWLGMVIVGFLWLLLGLYALILKNSDVYSEDYDTYDFKDDVPMAKTATDTTAVGRSSGIPEPPKHTSMMSPYMIPHRDFANQSQETYYYSTQGTPVYDYNNSDIYMNSMPVEDHSLYKATSPLQQQYQSPANGFERQRKVSKTYLEEEDGELAPPSASAHSQEQPPHSYDGDRL